MTPVIATAVPDTNNAAEATPLVSCIMPTHNRRHFVPMAIRAFRRQEYPARELIVVDDGTDPVEDLVPPDPSIRYLRRQQKASVGMKRNLACAEARGSLIAHWDDDDWHAPWRLSYQVGSLLGQQADLCGLDVLWFFDPLQNRGWQFRYAAPGRRWLAGGSFCYRRSLWERHRFADIFDGEDTQFVAGLNAAKVMRLDRADFYLARIHGGNTNPKRPGGIYWHPAPVDTIRAMLGEDFAPFVACGVGPATEAADCARAFTLQGAGGGTEDLLNAGDARTAAAPVRGMRAGPADLARNSTEEAGNLRTGVSVVVPHGGQERLPHLAACLANMAQARGIAEVIVVDLGTASSAREIAQRWGANYVFVRNDGPFERARALNVGSALATHDLILWLDNDLLVPPGFVEEAANELRRRGLDFLIPYSAIHYLSGQDSDRVRAGTLDPMQCRAIASLAPGRMVSGGAGLVRVVFLREFGGIPEGFRGWGGEDNAWVYKASLLGHSGVSTNTDQRLWHLYHQSSGAHDPSVHSKNPHYAENLRLLGRISAPRDRRSFLQQFPPAPPTCAWERGKRVVFVVEKACAGPGSLAYHAKDGMMSMLGLDIPIIEATDDAQVCARLHQLSPDAVVVFGGVAGDRVFGSYSAPDASHGIVAVIGAQDQAPALSGAASYLIAPQVEVEAMASGRPIFYLPGSPADAIQIASALAQNLSLVLNSETPHGKPAVPRADAEPYPVWTYWEGECPDWIVAARATIAGHAGNIRQLDRNSFEQMREVDRDIDIDRLAVAHRADYIRAYLLARHGGLWLDSDCVVMKPLKPLHEYLQVSDFIAHRDRQGYFPNGFMGARRGSVLAAEFYRRICAILRSGRELGWISLGGEPLTQLLTHAQTPWRELDCELIQPICWSRPEAFFVVASREEHLRSFNPEAYCYMMSNTEVRKHQARRPELSLLARGSFFNFLLQQSAQVARQDGGLGLERLPGPRGGSDHQADSRMRDAKMAAHALSFGLANFAQLSPARVLEVARKTGRWGVLLSPEQAVATGDAPELHLIECSDSAGDCCRAAYTTVTRAPVETPLKDENRRWDLIVISDALNQWREEERIALLQTAMQTADYVLVWQWRDALAQSGALLSCLAPAFSNEAIRKQAGATVDGCDMGVFLLSREDPRLVGETAGAEVIFETIFRDNVRGGGESASGPGSSLAQTEKIRRILPHFLQSLGVRTVIDAPCGDFNWMKHVELGIDLYVGLDIVDEIVNRNRRLYSGPKRRFVKADIAAETLMAADLILCRDCLVHFSFDRIRRAIGNFVRSGAVYLLTTDFPAHQTNPDITTGDWRPLNFTLAPFGFPPPLQSIEEGCTEAGGRYFDKSLSLWRLSDIANLLVPRADARQGI